MKIAILAVCAGAFVLAQPELTQAAHSTVSASTSPARSAEFGLEPVIVLAQSAPISTSRSNIKHPSKKAGPSDKKASPSEANDALMQVSTTRGRVQKNEKKPSGANGLKKRNTTQTPINGIGGTGGGRFTFKP